MQDSFEVVFALGPMARQLGEEKGASVLIFLEVKSPPTMYPATHTPLEPIDVFA